MKRPIALLWLLLTLAPVGYVIFFMTYASGPLPPNYAAAEAQFNLIFRLQFIAIFFIWALVASYVVYLFKTSHVPVEKRALWAVVLFLGNMISMPIFWYLYVWRPTQAHVQGNASGP